MSREKKKSTGSWMRSIGIFLIGVSIFAGLLAIAQTSRNTFADFPCGYYHVPSFAQEPSTRIAYCIDFYGSNVISGGGIYAEGTSSQNQVVIATQPPVDGFSLERQGLSLLVIGQILQPGQSLQKLFQSPSLNPWLISTDHLTIQNAGLAEAGNALLITGSVEEGWLLNPFGLLILLGGITLILVGRKKD